MHADFECILNSVKSYEGSSWRNIKITFLVVLLINLLKNVAYEFIEAILKEYEYCKTVMKKHFNKNLITSEKEEEQFQSSKTCWIWEKLIDDEKVRDYCLTTGKFRGADHWSCNINLQLTKKVRVMFHNLRGHDSHLFFCELEKLDVKIDVIPNKLEKFLAFILNKKSVFIDSTQFMNSSLKELVKNLSDNDFKYLTQTFGS